MDPSQDGASNEFVDKYGSDQFRWYSTQAHAFERRLAAWTWISFFMGFLATAVAAFPAEEFFPENLLLFRWVIVVLSAAATLTAGTLVPRYQNLYRAREAGRVKTALVMNLAPVELAASSDVDRQLRLKTQFMRDLLAVEGAYGTIAAPEKEPLPREPRERVGELDLRPSA